MDNSLYNPCIIDGCFKPKVYAYYFREWNNYDMKDGHSHNCVEIMYVISGKCAITAQGNLYCLKKGDFILLDANVQHALIVGKNETCRMLNVEFGFVESDDTLPPFRALVEGCQPLIGMLEKQNPYYVLKDPDEIYPVLKSLIMELDRKVNMSVFMIQFLVYELLIKMSRLMAEWELEKLPGSHMYVRKAISYIHQNYDKSLRIEDIASALALHPVYFQRVFKKNTGITPLEYLNNLRIDKAKMMLEITDIPIIEISDYVGINSRQYFSYLFKKVTGMSPAEYRQINKVNIKNS